MEKAEGLTSAFRLPGYLKEDPENLLSVRHELASASAAVAETIAA